MGLKPKAIARVGNRFILVPFPSLLGSATAPPEIPSGPPSASWTLDFSTGEPWSNGTNYVFSSTASTSRTFVNSSGYVAPCVANLTQRSEDLANAAWNKTRVSITANDSTAPDGTTTADRIVEDTANNFRGVDSSNAASLVAGGNRCWSIYVKKPSTNGRSIVGIAVEDGGNGYFGKRFDLDAGTAVGADYNTNTTNITNLAYGIVNVGSGWYRCWVSARCANSGNCDGRVSPMLSSTSAFFAGLADTYQGDGVSGILAWGGQFEEASTPSPYSATTTSSNGIPRLTHNSSGQRLGLLVEGQRTNICLATEDFTDSARWPPIGVTVANGTNAAPDNGADAETIKESGATAAVRNIRSGSLTTGVAAGDTFTASAFIKDDPTSGRGYGYVAVTVDGGTTRTYTVIVDLSNGALETTMTAGSPTGTAYTIESVGNGWYRVSATVTAQTGATGVRIRIGMWASGATNSSGFPSYAITSGQEKSILAWGAQIEEAATPSSYIPNSANSGSGVTRSADLAYVETADVTNWGRPGSFVVEYYKPLEQSGGVVVADDDGAGNAGRLGVEYSAGGPRIVYGTSGSGSGGTDTAGLNKIGWAWNGSGAATRSALNGAALNTSLATSFDPSLTDGINLGGNIDWSTLPLTVSGQPNVVIRRVRFWNSQLSAADLNTLTT